MNLKMLVLAAAFGACLAAAAPSEAQQPVGPAWPRARSQQRPLTSPYLNLLAAPGGSLAFEYHRRVRPEQEFRSGNQRLSRSLGTVEQRLDRDEQAREQPTGARRIPTTGHSAKFMSYGNYFPTLSR